MSNEWLRRRDVVPIVATIALLGALVSVSSLAGQTDLVPAVLESVEEDLVPNGHVTVVGNGFLSGAAVAPLRPGPCGVSQRSPVELAVRGLGATFIVDNLACHEASMATMSREQVPQIDPMTQLIVVGGLGLEFDWPRLSDACLDAATRSAGGCITTAQLQRATAANSFFSWRSLLEQMMRTAPDASIVVVGPPMPVTRARLLLGSGCCSVQVDAHERVRSAFETAAASRRAVVESLSDPRIVHLDTGDTFSGHRTDESVSWLIAPGDVDDGLAGLPNHEGAVALAEAIRPLLPEPIEATAIPPTLHEVALLVGLSSAHEDEIASIEGSLPDWFAAHRDRAVELAVAVVPIVSAQQPDQPDPDPDPEPEANPRPLDEDPDAPHVVELDPAQVGPAPASALPPLATLFLEGPEAVSATLAALELDTPSLSLDDLVAAVERSATLDWTPGSVRELVLVLDDSTVAALLPTQSDIDNLLPGLAPIQASIEVLTPEALPAPPQEMILVDLVVPAVVAASSGEPIELRAGIVSDRATRVALDWFLDDELIAVGQTALIDANVLSAGVYELAVRATAAGDALERTTQLLVSVDGDGNVEGDSCPSAFDPSLSDIDGDGVGDVCDTDDDGDLVPDDLDPCVRTPDKRLLDIDLDGRPNNCDGDSLDGPSADFDSDDAPDRVDNCPSIANRDQADVDDDGIGDACDDRVELQCTITGTPGDDRIEGTAGDDVICGLEGNDVLLGLAGNDVLYGGAGDDVLRGGSGVDRIFGSSGEDHLFGSAGDDIIIGGTGTDRLAGGDGNDVLGGAGGRDRLEGGTGNDLLVGGAAGDRMFGELGNDLLLGGQGPDTLLGNEGDDLLDGGGGANQLYGGNGDDRLIDVSTRDTSIPGSGTDLVGGASVRVG